MPKDFSRDLGYLAKFLDALRAHAATLGEPAGSRLAALLGEQDRAWAEIKGILAGEPAAAPANPALESSATSGAIEGQAEAAPKRLTVGSLIS